MQDNIKKIELSPRLTHNLDPQSGWGQTNPNPGTSQPSRGHINQRGGQTNQRGGYTNQNNITPGTNQPG